MYTLLRKHFAFVLALIIIAGLNPGIAQAAPLQADGTLTLVLVNKTGANIWFNLEGEQNYYFQLGDGRSKQEVLKGKYEYTYWACNAWQLGTLEVKKDLQKFVLESCSALAKASQTKTMKGVELTLINKTGANVYLTLTGPQTYYQPVGDARIKLDVQKGEYEYTYYACGKYNTGTLKVKNKQKFTLPDCFARAPGTRKMVVNNYTGGWLWINLVKTQGNVSYQFRLASGKNIVYILPGNYEYSAWSVCGPLSGVTRLNSGMRWQFWCQ